MKFYFIYSAGGGAGDWNGLKRVWSNSMPESLKSKILLKFGDVFLEHATGNRIIRPQRWNNIQNLRMWLYENINDTYVYSNDCKILLDSGTAKAVNLIANHNPTATCDEMIETFNRMFFDNAIFEKYINIVCDSQINKAVTFDIPNPFKIRSQNANTRLNILERESNNKLIELSATYSNILFNGIKEKLGEAHATSVVTTTINGTWTANEIDLFFSKLDYNPSKNIAVGGLSSTKISPSRIGNYLDNLINIGFENSDFVHFLGCGGLKKSKAIRNYGFSGDNISVDCSTFINRSIDGNITGSSKSGYFDYNSKELIRISEETKDLIIQKHSNCEHSKFSSDEMAEILNTIIAHQNGHSSPETYDARAKLIIHNADVFRHNVES